MYCFFNISLRKELWLNELPPRENSSEQIQHTLRNWKLIVLIDCFVALRPKSTAMIMAGRSVNLTTLFSWASLNKQLTSTSCTYFCLQLTTTILEWFSGREEIDRRNYFMLNLHKSMGPGGDRTRIPWICSQTRICCQTHYRLCYAARYWKLTFINYNRSGWK